MAKSQLTFKKKDLEKKKKLKKQHKMELRAEKKMDNDKGKSLEEMYVYVDEHGNLSPTPPLNPYKFKIEDLERPADAEDLYYFGKVSFYNEIGRYGFIRDNETGSTVYFNDELAGMILKVDQKVKYKWSRSVKGNQITEVVLQ